MDIEFDPRKSAKNAKERGLPFEKAAELEWKAGYTYAHDRRDYGESRVIALGPMKGRLYVACYSDRGSARRIISLRKANKREEKIYAEVIANR